MITSGDLKKGIIIELGGELYQVLDYHHIKAGRGSAQIRLKLRDIHGGHTTERTFPSTEKFVRVNLDYRTMQYLYNDGQLYYLMDEETYEQTPLSNGQLGDALNYLKEGMSLRISGYKGEITGVELPDTVELKVADTGSSFKGDTASTATKPATLETGITIQVPMFVNTGDVIRVDTRTGLYIERVS
jgi:elongation factor P